MPEVNETQYTVIAQEKTEKDLPNLRGYWFQVAKSVAAAGGDPTFNVVFESRDLAPIMKVSWTTQYGLNWTTDVPNPGAKVTFSGTWQPCNLGESYDLNDLGVWSPNPNDPNAKTDSLNVGNNGYTRNVNVLVGTQDLDTKEWKTIWLGKTPLLLNGNGQYKPLETVELWFEEGEKDQTMISQQGTKKAQQDMSDHQEYYFHYDTEKGAWDPAQTTPFPWTLVGNNYGDQDELIPIISIRKGVFFEGLTFKDIAVSG